MKVSIKALFFGVFMIACAGASLPQGAMAQQSASDIDHQVDAALNNLYAVNPDAVQLASKAKAILVFPTVVKGGFLFGGEFGVGALRESGRTKGYYSTAGASYGLQIGVQSYGYALFLMDSSAMSYLDSVGGWQIGVGPSVVVLDQGMARSMTTATEMHGIYAFIFDQRGLMAGAGIQGSKITPYTPDY